jgi:hypothetical protein
MGQADFQQGASPPTWRAFIEGPLYADEAAPWRDDPAFALLCQYPGLRDSIGGRIAEALQQAVGLVQALTQVDLFSLVHTHPQPQGLCLGFGMNALEPYDLLQVFALARVHGYEWVGEQVIEAAQTLLALTRGTPTASAQIRLHHGTLSDLHALPNRSIQVVYVGNVFTAEVPMAATTFTRAVGEMLRVLAVDGLILSRGSAGELESALTSEGTFLLRNPLVSVFQRKKG